MPSILINRIQVPVKAMKMSTDPKFKDVSLFSTSRRDNNSRRIAASVPQEEKSLTLGERSQSPGEKPQQQGAVSSL